MHTEQNCNNRFLGLLVLGIALFVIASIVHADPPSRVARLAYSTGPVGFSPAGEEEWVEATLNRPLVTGDRLWSDNGARVELSIGTAAVRLGSTTSVTLLNLDDNVVQLRLAQGTLNIRVRRLDARQVIEVDTPNLAYVIRRPGQYRISVDPDGDATEVVTRNGQADVYGEGASYVVASGRVYRFYGTGLREYELLPLQGIDEFDRWAQDRDRRYDRSASYRYVSRDVIGAQDLDEYGAWRTVPEYGNVWMPTRVATGWAPYRDGHWAWVDPWGWTWIDDAPWGFAVSHYGRWANFNGRWGWIPGPVAARAVYAPALVAFVGGSNFQISVSSGAGAVGWFPLGPRDVYRPAYTASRAYFSSVNTSNTVLISNTYVTNVYNNRNVTNVTYVNQQVPGAIVAVPAAAFVQSQPVARAAIALPRDAAMRAPVSAVAAVAPQQISVRGAAAQGAKPPPQVMERPVIARSAPPPAPVAFAARERTLAAQPGQPVDPSALAGMRSAKPMPEPKVEVVTGVRSAMPQAAPPPQSAQQTMQRRDERRAMSPGAAPNARSAESTPNPQAPQAPITQPVRPTQPAQAQPAPPATSPLTQPVRPTQPTPQAPTPPAAPPSQGLPRALPPQVTPQAAPEQRGNAEQRRQQDVAPASGRPPQATTPPPAAAPAARPMQPATPPLATPQDTRGRGEARGQPAPAAAAPAPVVAPPAAVQAPRPTVAPAPPAAAEQRGRPDARGAPAQAAQPAPAATPLPRAAPEAARRAEPAQPPKAAPGAPAPAAPVALSPATSPPPATTMQRGPRGNVPGQPNDKKTDDDKDDDKKRK